MKNVIDNIATPQLTTDEYVDLVNRVYTWGYPLILMDLTKKISTNTTGSVKDSALGKAPINQVARVRATPTADFTSVVKPNVDTYYTTSWLDLSDGPLVLEVPQTERYYLLPLLDAYSNIFESIGTRTGYTEEKYFFFIKGPNHVDVNPQGNHQGRFHIIQAPTNMVWMLGRVEVKGYADGVKNVYPIQDKIQIVPYQYYGSSYTPPAGITDSDNDNINPVEYIADMRMTAFFSQMAELMNDNPPADYDMEIVQQMKLIGIEKVDGKYQSFFSEEKLPTGVRLQTQTIPYSAGENWKAWYNSNNTAEIKNGWSIQIRGKGRYKDHYNLRAYQAYTGLGANLPEDAIYPTLTSGSYGSTLDSTKNYTLTFSKDALPPVHDESFWSLTVYNNNGYLVKNYLHRYALGSNTKAIQNEIDDGNVTIYIQAEKPDDDSALWLPITNMDDPGSATSTEFSLTLRLYWPEDKALVWSPPELEEVE
ncbi:MAG: DUF1254 domain-containing protein [Saprospiraceae bacterium]